MAECQHSYNGSHDEGWTCGICGDHQDEVAYTSTVEHQEKQAAIREAEKDLSGTTRAVMADTLRMAYRLSFTHKTLPQFRRALVSMIEEAEREGGEG